MNLLHLFLYFFIYSFLGWCIEVTYCGIISRKWVNRGFLIGPYCPIYGCAAIVMIYALNIYIESPFILFIMASLITTTIEYITSYIMEKVFKTRWWDYSNKSFNINGRVFLGNSLMFGLLSFIMMYLVHPFISNIIINSNDSIIIIITIIIGSIFIIDLFFTIATMFKIKDKLTLKLEDCTEEINNIMKSFLSNNKFYISHIVKAFPNPITKNKEIINFIKKLFIIKFPNKKN